MTVSKIINKKTTGMINNNIKSQLFQCKCFCKSVKKKKKKDFFVLRGANRSDLHTEKKREERKNKNMPDHAVYHQQQEGVTGWKETGAPPRCER